MATTTGTAMTRRVMRATRNRAADGLLIESIKLPHPLRWVAIDALASRPSRQNQLTLLGEFRNFSNVERDLLIDHIDDFQLLLEDILAGVDAKLTESACRFINYYKVTKILPTIVRRSTDSRNAYANGLAATALQLARELDEQAEAYRQDRSLRDPIFERRAAVLELAAAVNRYRDHERGELIEAFLLLTPADNSMLSRILEDKTHAAHPPLTDALATSPSRGAWELLARMIEDPGTPVALLEMALARGDAAFLVFVAESFPLPLSRRVTDNLQRFRKVGWLETSTRVVPTLPEQAQQVLLEMAYHTRAPRMQVFELARRVLEAGASGGRAKACEILGRIDVPRGQSTLEAHIDDADARVAATASAVLYDQGYNTLRERLQAFIDHRDEATRTVARRALRNTTFFRFQSQFDDLDSEQREAEGRIVAAVDPLAIEMLTKEFQAATVDRRLRAIAMSQAMGVVEKVIDRLAELNSDKDAAVRTAAIEVLASSRAPQAVAAVEMAQHDANGAVRRAAQEAQRRMEQAGIEAALFAEVRAHANGDW